MQAAVEGLHVLLELFYIGLDAGSVFVVLVGQQVQVLNGVLQLLAVGGDDACRKQCARLGLELVKRGGQLAQVFFAGGGDDHGQRRSSHEGGDFFLDFLGDLLHIFWGAVVGLGDDEQHRHLGNSQLQQCLAQAGAQCAFIRTDHYAIGQAAVGIAVNDAVVRFNAGIPTGQVHQYQLRAFS